MHPITILDPASHAPSLTLVMATQALQVLSSRSQLNPKSQVCIMAPCYADFVWWEKHKGTLCTGKGSTSQ